MRRSAFLLPPSLDTLSWRRKGLWSIYPEWHIARLSGQTLVHCAAPSGKYGEPPDREWQQEETDFIAFGRYDTGRRGTEDFRSSKFSILRADMSSHGEGPAFAALSDGSDSVRMELVPQPGCIIGDRDPAVRYTGSWVRQDTKFRSLNGTETWSKTAGDTALVTFRGTGICWISSYDLICGTARVYVDGALRDGSIPLNVHLGPGVPRGYEKDYRRLAYAVTGLAPGEHTLCIEVTGKKAENAMNSYVNIDHFVVLDPAEAENIRFIVNSEVNFPELSWGDYTKPPVTADTGYSRTVYTQLAAR